MSHIQIYIHGENAREPKALEIAEEALVSEIIDIYRREFPDAGTLEEIELFIEEEPEPKEKHHHRHHAGIGKRAHVHCHRCRQVEVNLIYNGDDKSYPFPPSATVKTVLKKAISAFNINPADAGDYVLKLDDKTILQPADHIGSFTSWPRCQLKLFLTALKPIQG
jgi:hypothetical protein